ncbi:MAG: DUF1059 domain-containing protein [Aquihabitans sp.]
MTKSMACGDVVPGCAAVFKGSNDNEVLAQVADHAASEHGLTEIDDATLKAVKAAIRTS